MAANPSPVPEVLASVEAQVREIHHYGCPPDARLQGRVDRDVESIMEPMRAALSALAAATREAETLRDAGNQMNGILMRLGLDSHMDVALALDAWKLALLAPRSPEGEERVK